MAFIIGAYSIMMLIIGDLYQGDIMVLCIISIGQDIMHLIIIGHNIGQGHTLVIGHL